MKIERPKVGVNVFVIKDNKLLLGKGKNVFGDGYWGLPGGHLEGGESMTGGAKRELKEETGLTADKLTFLNVINDPPIDEGGHYVHVGFLAEDVQGEPRLTEPDKCSELKWFDLNDLPQEEEIFIGHRKQIAAFLNKIVFVD
ncbi:MAG: NUDIX domain-containing protein [Candidatus Paceibacterota bacterium]